MTTLRDLPRRWKHVARVSVEEFHRVTELGLYGKRAELIRGIVFEKPPMSPLHRKLSKRLHEHLLGSRARGRVIFHEAPLTLSDSEPIPDLMVVAGTDADFDRQHPSTAELVIEVAVSSESFDCENAALYAEAGVKEYWIALGARQQVEVSRELEGGEYRERRIYAGADAVACTCLPEIRVPLAALFA